MGNIDVMDTVRARVLDSLGKMDEQAGQQIAAIAEQYAAQWPCKPKSQRLLRLVVPGDTEE